MPERTDGRHPNQLRPVKITPNYNKHAEGSALIEFGETRVICTASVEEKIPSFLRGTGQGWVTAEYGMIPRSTGTRMIRESSKGKLSGRTQEIQRLIGRSLRSVVDLKALKERTIWIDCDVIQADGGTRTASITGAYIALVLAASKLNKGGTLSQPILLDYVAAASVGLSEGVAFLDLSYEEDFAAEVDMNVVMTGQGLFVEVQGTAEQRPFSPAQLDSLLEVAGKGIIELIGLQQQSLQDQLEDLDNLFIRETNPSAAVSSGNL